ncbi:MAG: hypothetical protein FJ014_09965 [Chloroflexi bacterium]|nr:hypothetical protein [Chloroflexota bacterium]
MKLIAAMVQDEDVDELLGTLMETGCRATKIQTSGGFLRGSNNIVLIGVEKDRVEQVLKVLQTHCHSRTQTIHPSEASYLSDSITVTIGGATVFVWDVERYERL